MEFTNGLWFMKSLVFCNVVQVIFADASHMKKA